MSCTCHSRFFANCDFLCLVNSDVLFTCTLNTPESTEEEKFYSMGCSYKTSVGAGGICENQNQLWMSIQHCSSSCHEVPMFPEVLKVEKSWSKRFSHGDPCHLLSHVGETALSENNAKWKKWVKSWTVQCTPGGYNQILNESTCKKLGIKNVKYKIWNAKYNL